MKQLQQAQQLPKSITTAVNALLEPYGFDIDVLTRPQPEQSSKVRYLSPADAAQYASMSRWTIHRAIKAGELPAIKMNKAKTGKVLIDIADMDRWIRKHKIRT